MRVCTIVYTEEDLSDRRVDGQTGEQLDGQIDEWILDTQTRRRRRDDRRNGRRDGGVEG